MSTAKAVLLMAYGTPDSLDDVEAYFTHIRGGHRPSADAVANLRARYERVGGGTPLRRITERVREDLESTLAADGEPRRVYVGMKHWHPYIAQAVEEITRDGHRRVIALALAPHYSRFSIDGYVQRVHDAIAKSNAQLDVTYIQSWNDHPLFLRSVAERMETARQGFGAMDWDQIEVVFSAHSLPEKILLSNDPYPQ